jgi:hypothetical protein
MLFFMFTTTVFTAWVETLRALILTIQLPDPCGIEVDQTNPLNFTDCAIATISPLLSYV